MKALSTAIATIVLLPLLLTSLNIHSLHLSADKVTSIVALFWLYSLLCAVVNKMSSPSFLVRYQYNLVLSDIKTLFFSGAVCGLTVLLTYLLN